MTEHKSEKEAMTTDAADSTVAASYPACREKARLLYRGVALAPMVRASTTPLRLMALKYGADFTYTEELVDRSLSQTIRVENKELQTIDYIKDPALLPKKTKKKLKADNNRPCLILRIDPKVEKDKLICQMGTGEPELALEAAKKVVGDVAAIDVNMGCPKKFSVSGGMGSALLKDPDRAARILASLKSLLGPLGKPLSCKIRLLATTQETVDFVERMIRAGADAVAIHARRVSDDSTKAANWKSLEEVLEILRPKYPDFNFLVNGDFYDRKERAEFMERTKVDGVLLGRPALYNTSTFLPLGTAEADKTTVIQEYMKYSVRFDSHHKNTKYVVNEMMSHRRTPNVRVPYLPMKFPQGQTVGKTCNCHDLASLCKLWNVDYSKALATSTAGGTNVDSECSKTTTLAAGEHRYEDSYFLKSEQADTEKKGDDTSSETHLQNANHNGGDQNRDPVDRASKRTKIVSEKEKPIINTT
uniref:DUS-like FMN-binding domain-containing protein n=1 Tax=Pseudo-nitzschia australis TaxID=44445 RepID=A0A7S4EQV4_9STRA|mmetsp:Transcript_9643/g.20897  ORF Transcript_9643/g.20897 Transcript_9643/m.20897 type:complete len:474 (+) Transcript_9643:142-1563(+)